jgi:hypothetical protein
MDIPLSGREASTMHNQKANYRRTAAFAICAGCVVTASVLMIYKYKPVPVDPIATASVERAIANIGTLLLPDGQGGCLKYSYGNDTGKATFEGSAPCDGKPPKGAPGGGLPPVLQGMQNSLRPR